MKHVSQNLKKKTAWKLLSLGVYFFGYVIKKNVEKQFALSLYHDEVII